jgi:hypothetical protein
MKPTNPIPAAQPGPIAAADPEASSSSRSSSSSSSRPSHQRETPPPAPSGLYEVVIGLRILEKLDRDEPIRIRSVLSPEGERSIQVWLASSDPLVGRALQKADVILTKFLVCCGIAEFMNFHRERADGQAIRCAILDAAGLPKISYSGIGLGGRLSRSQFLANLDSAQIFGPMPATNRVELRRMSIRLRLESDIPHWQARGEPKKENINV